jgi:hypothetical protein
LGDVVHEISEGKGAAAARAAQAERAARHGRERSLTARGGGTEMGGSEGGREVCRWLFHCSIGFYDGLIFVDRFSILFQASHPLVSLRVLCGLCGYSRRLPSHRSPRSVHARLEMRGRLA